VATKERQEKTRGAKPLRTKDLKEDRKQGRAGRRPDGRPSEKRGGDADRCEKKGVGKKWIQKMMKTKE
jgi:hypothetical protein